MKSSLKNDPLQKMVILNEDFVTDIRHGYFQFAWFEKRKTQVLGGKNLGLANLGGSSFDTYT
jgi:hypothetical protein